MARWTSERSTVVVRNDETRTVGHEVAPAVAHSGDPPQDRAGKEDMKSVERDLLQQSPHDASRKVVQIVE